MGVKMKKSNAPTLELWKRLYEVSGVIKKLEPWLSLWDTDLFTIQLPDREEPVYISVMGQIGECFGIGIYPGYLSILGFYKLLHADEKDPASYYMSRQDCLMCYWGDRDELSPEERGIIKELGLRFRGSNNWNYFRSMKEGYYPWFINSEQAELIAVVLENFVMAYQYIASGKIEIDFDNDETLYRSYSPEKGLWLNSALKMPPIPQRNKQRYIIDDIKLLQTLKAQKKTSKILEFDMIYMPTPIQEAKDEIPYFPRLILLVDQSNEQCISQKMPDKNETSEAAVITTFRDYIMKYGRPAAIQVRDEKFSSYIGHLCKEIDVKLAVGKGMPCINALSAQLEGYMSRY